MFFWRFLKKLKIVFKVFQSHLEELRDDKYKDKDIQKSIGTVTRRAGISFLQEE